MESKSFKKQKDGRNTMKKQLVSLLLILCMTLAVFSLASCDKGGKNDVTEAPVTTEPVAKADDTTAEATTTDKWEKLAPNVKIITEKERSLRFELSNHTTAEKSSKNDVYLKGPDTVEDGVTPKIQQMVYERNKTANDLLGTKIDYDFWDGGMGSLAERMDLVIKGKASDAPDLFVNMLFELSREMLNGGFKDVWSIPNSFFDFDSDGWLKEWMENLSFSRERAYILGSDYFLDVFRAIPVLPFNVDMMNENAVKLAPAILEDGEALGTDEKLTPRFFDLVERGDWTWDVLGELCAAIWVDLDNDGADSINDQLGILADEFGEGGQCACSFIYSCGEELTVAYPIEDESSAYNNRQWLKYADTSEGLNRIFDAVKSVIDGAGSLSTNYTHAGNSPDQPGIAYHQTKFAAGEVLFAGAQLLGALEDEVFQNMEDLYSVVPLPKTDSTKSYNSIVYSTGDAGSINVNVKPAKGKALTAYLQYCTEHSPAIREQFLQIVMKYKVTTYDQGTDRMLNTIYASILWGRDKLVDDLAGVNSNRWHSFMRLQHFAAGSDYISTQYATYRASKQSELDKIMQKWYTLPKTGDTGVTGN